MFAPTSAGIDAPLTAHPVGDVTGKHHQSSHDGTQPQLPSVNQGQLPPGSVLDPTQGAGAPTGQQTNDATSDPIGSLTQGLTGGGSQPTANPTTNVGGAVDSTTNDVKQLLDGVTDTVKNTLP